MPESFKTDATISHYRILTKLGAGGMGEVYLAQDTKLNRTIALKILPAELASNRDRMRRFVQEAQAAAGLNHPNIAHIYEIGELDHVNYIAMEFIDGVTLRGKIHEQRTDLTKLLKFLQQVAEGLAKAHVAGIVHRDLKPDNVMITPDGYAKILDFGLAKLVEPQQSSGASSEDSSGVATAILQRHSTPGTIVGTAGYMSPEQAQGKTKEIDHRSDIFSFGCILYEAATRQMAFEGKDVIESLNKIIREPVSPISDFFPQAPNHLQRIVRRCLAKDPDDRYQTIKDVAIELRELRRELQASGELRTTAPSSTPSAEAVSNQTKIATANTPSQDEKKSYDANTEKDAFSQSSSWPGRSMSSAEYLGSELKRRKMGVALIVAVLIIALLIVGRTWLIKPSVDVIDTLAVLPFINISGDKNLDRLSDGLTQDLIKTLSQLPHLKVMSLTSVSSYKPRDSQTELREPRVIGNELGVSHLLVGRVAKVGDSLSINIELINAKDSSYIWSEQYTRRLSEIFGVQQEIAGEMPRRLQLALSADEQLRLEAYLFYLKGRYYFNKRTASDVRRAIEYFDQATRKDQGYAPPYAGLADCYSLLVVYGALPPGEAFLKAKLAAEKALTLDDTLAEAHASLAFVKNRFEWDWAGAESEYRRAIELNANYGTARMWYSNFLVAMGREEEAIQETRVAREMDPLSPIVNANMGYVLFFAHQYKQAIEECSKVIEMDSNFFAAHRYLGLAYEQVGRYEDSIAELQKAKDLSGGSPVVLAALGHAYAVAGKRNEAQTLLDDLIAASKRRRVSPYDVAVIYTGLGDNDQAFAWLERAYEERNESLCFLKVEPRFGPLHSDRRFADLVRRVGLSQ